MLTGDIQIDDVECWNDGLALEHDIDDYYERSGRAIQFVEQRRLAIIRDMVRGEPDDAILEVGCGGGHVLRMFSRSDLTGVDVSGVFLDKARRNLSACRVTLLKGELDSVDLPDGKFDKAICTEVIEHVVTPDRILRALQKKVRRGGTVVMTFPNDRLIEVVKRTIRCTGAGFLPGLRRVSWGADKYHLHRWRVREMRSLLSRFFVIRREAFSPWRFLPLRCCFECENALV